MNEALKRFSSDAAEKIIASLSSKDVADFVERAKAATDSGEFVGLVISTEHKDRQGEILLQDGMDSTLFMKNPVVLNSHDYQGIQNIVDIATKLYPGEVDGVKATLADGIWAPTEEGQLARTLWDGKFLSASSVGLMPTQFNKANSNIIEKWQLLEFSMCPVPANGYATRLRQMGLTADGIRAKGFSFEVKEDVVAEEENMAAAGDDCTLEDGSTGILDVRLVCIPKAIKTETEEEKAIEEKGAVSDQLDAAANMTWDMMDQKFGNMCKVWDVIDALAAVYFNDVTPVEGFEALVAETVEILKNVQAGAAMPESGTIVEAMVKYAGKSAFVNRFGKKFTLITKEVSSDQIGAITVKLQGDVDALIIQASKDLIALAPTPEPTTPKGAEAAEVRKDNREAETPAGAPAAKPRSKSTEFTQETSEKEILKETLKDIYSLISDSLGRAKKARQGNAK